MELKGAEDDQENTQPYHKNEIQYTTGTCVCLSLQFHRHPHIRVVRMSIEWISYVK